MTLMIVPGEDLPVSYLNLVERFSERFYTADTDRLRQLYYANVLAAPEEARTIEWWHDFSKPPDGPGLNWRQPTLVEITRCWCSLLHQYHGLTTTTIATSTNGILLLLTRNKYLDIRRRKPGQRTRSMFVRNL